MANYDQRDPHTGRFAKRGIGTDPYINKVQRGRTASNFIQNAGARVVPNVVQNKGKGIGIRIDASDLNKLVQLFSNMQPILMDPATMIPAITDMGYHWDQAFARGGNSFGSPRWQNLTEATRNRRNVRAVLGQIPDANAPILTQSGGLRKVAAKPFFTWPGYQRNASAQDSSPAYGDESGPLEMTASISPKNMRATITGNRVQNQFGGALPDGRYLPARRFWWFNPQLVQTMSSMTAERIMEDWASTSTLSTKRGRNSAWIKRLPQTGPRR